MVSLIRLAERSVIVSGATPSPMRSIAVAFEATVRGRAYQALVAYAFGSGDRGLTPVVRVPAIVRLTAIDADCFEGATLVLSAVPRQSMLSVWQRLARQCCAAS